VARNIATNTTVTRDELLQFVRTRHHAIVITYPDRAKTRNARRDPTHVSVLFLSDERGGRVRSHRRRPGNSLAAAGERCL